MVTDTSKLSQEQDYLNIVYLLSVASTSPKASNTLNLNSIHWVTLKPYHMPELKLALRSDSLNTGLLSSVGLFLRKKYKRHAGLVNYILKNVLSNFIKYP